MNRPVTVTVVGATGAVGETMLAILEQRDFPVGELIPLASARSRIPVLPSPCLWVASVPPAASVWVTISPSTYDSVNRFEPTFSGSAAHAAAPTQKNSHKQTFATESPIAIRGRWLIIGAILAGGCRTGIRCRNGLSSGRAALACCIGPGAGRLRSRIAP